MGVLTSEELLALLAEVGHAQRLWIIAELAAGTPAGDRATRAKIVDEYMPTMK